MIGKHFQTWKLGIGSNVRREIQEWKSSKIFKNTSNKRKLTTLEDDCTVSFILSRLKERKKERKKEKRKKEKKEKNNN